MTREDQVEKMLDELEEEFAKANMPVNDKLTLFAKVSNIIYKYAEQEPYTDCISRQAAIRIAEQGQIQGYEWQFKELVKLPPVSLLDNTFKDLINNEQIDKNCETCEANNFKHKYFRCNRCEDKSKYVKEVIK